MISPVWANTLIFVGSKRNVYGVICCSYMYVAFLNLSCALTGAFSPNHQGRLQEDRAPRGIYQMGGRERVSAWDFFPSPARIRFV